MTNLIVKINIYSFFSSKTENINCKQTFFNGIN